MEVEDRVQPSNFFRTKLLGLTTQEQVKELVDRHKRASDALLDEVIALTIETDGGYSRNDAWAMSPHERGRVAEYLIKRKKAREEAAK